MKQYNTWSIKKYYFFHKYYYFKEDKSPILLLSCEIQPIP